MQKRKGFMGSLVIIAACFFTSLVIYINITDLNFHTNSCNVCEYDNYTSRKSLDFDDDIVLVQCGTDTLLIRHMDLTKNAFGEYRYSRVDNIFCNIEEGLYRTNLSKNTGD